MHLGRILVIALVFASAGAISAGELDGRWPSGRWTDTNTGHDGPLKARFRQVDDCHYRVVFTGKFRKVAPFRFATTLNVVGQDGDKVFFEGESRLMGFFKFSYSAVADEHQFHADYQSRRWTGNFELSR